MVGRVSINKEGEKEMAGGPDVVVILKVLVGLLNE